MWIRWRGTKCLAPGKKELAMVGTAVRFRYDGLDSLGRKRRLVLSGVIEEVEPWHPRRTHRYVVVAGNGYRYLISKDQIL